MTCFACPLYAVFRQAVGGRRCLPAAQTRFAFWRAAGFAFGACTAAATEVGAGGVAGASFAAGAGAAELGEPPDEPPPEDGGGAAGASGAATGVAVGETAVTVSRRHGK